MGAVPAELASFLHYNKMLGVNTVKRGKGLLGFTVLDVPAPYLVGPVALGLGLVTHREASPWRQWSGVQGTTVGTCQG